MGWKDVDDETAGDSGSDGKYDKAREMGQFLRGWARWAVTGARAASVILLLLGVFVFMDEPLASIPLLLMAVISWFWATPLAIMLRGIADLGDALVDIACTSSAMKVAAEVRPVAKPAGDTQEEDPRALAKRIAAEALAKVQNTGE